MIRALSVQLSLTIGLFAVPAIAADVTLSPGESVTIGGTTVVCGRTKTRSRGTLCHDFYSDDACAKVRVGAPCLKGGKKGTCTSEDDFGGQANCKCIP